VPKKLPKTLSINDAAALVMNISFLPNSTDLVEMLEYFQEEAESKYDKATGSDEKIKYKSHIAMTSTRVKMGKEVLAAINSELTCINNGEESLLKVEENNFGSEKLDTESVLYWASVYGFGIQGWEPPRFWRKATERRHNTEYLSVLDDVIATFCEEGGEHYIKNTEPQKSAVSTWIKGKYSFTSEKVRDAIGTIIRRLPHKA
jgi:hypothetical protein